MRCTATRIMSVLLMVVVLRPMSLGAQLWLYHPPAATGINSVGAVALDSAGGALVAGALGSHLGVVKLSGSDGTELWRHVTTTCGGAFAVATDSAGDAVAAGQVDPDMLCDAGDFAVVKLSGASGAELWRYAFAGLGFGGLAQSVAVDGTGDVLAAGSTITGASNYGRFVVAKLAASDGAELWRREIDGTGVFASAYARAVAVDGAGDALALGEVTGPSGWDLVIVKFAGATGDEQWRVVLDQGTWGSIAVDGTGDVVAGATTTTGGFTVAKLAGADGALSWRRDDIGIGGDPRLVRALAVDASGDVVAGGKLGPEQFFVVKLDGATGADRWQYSVSGDAVDRSLDRTTDAADSVAIDSAGDVIAAGEIDNRVSNADGFVTKLRGTDGAEQWHRVIKGTETGGPDSFVAAVDVAGDVIAAGNALNEDPTPPFTVLKVDGASGGDFLFAGNKLRFRDVESDPTKRRLFVKARDGSAPSRGGPDDPTLGGGSLTLLNPTTGESDTFPLPAANWAATSRGFSYRDPARASGPCTKLDILDNRKLSAKCDGSQITFSLDEPAQGSLAVRLTTGSAGLRQCLRFGGTVGRDTPSTGSRAGYFLARSAPPPASCP
jgi:hypothetical protein